MSYYMQVGPTVVAVFADKRGAMKSLDRFAPGINVKINLFTKKTHYTGEKSSGPKHNTSEKISYLKPGDFTL